MFLNFRRLKESDRLDPKNIYGLSKKINEEIAELYQKNYKINFIGLRFFTIYGEWGRPDMFMLKLFKSYLNKDIFYLMSNCSSTIKTPIILVFFLYSFINTISDSIKPQSV